MDSKDALKLFEVANDIKLLSDSDAQLYNFDKEAHNKITEAKPWNDDAHYFKRVQISSIALVKMVMHARSGNDIEVMGLMLGKVLGDTMVVLDVFALPVEGTETRVNAQQDGYEYMIRYMMQNERAGINEPVIGWYHSHPGYGCWLSGIDVDTQLLNQKFQDPFLAIVIDPKRTMSSGKVDLGAFRTFPENYSALSRNKKGSGEDGGDGFENIPLDKVNEFGVHSDRYYSLEVGYFKSNIDDQLLQRLWRKYWINTLSQSPLITNCDFISQKISDLAERLVSSEKNNRLESNFSRTLRDTEAIIEEISQGYESNKLKLTLFNKPLPEI